MAGQFGSGIVRNGNENILTPKATLPCYNETVVLCFSEYTPTQVYSNKLGIDICIVCNNLADASSGRLVLARLCSCASFSKLHSLKEDPGIAEIWEADSIYSGSINNAFTFVSIKTVLQSYLGTGKHCFTEPCVRDDLTDAFICICARVRLCSESLYADWIPLQGKCWPIRPHAIALLKIR